MCKLKLKRKFLYDSNNDIEKYFDEGINEIILKSVENSEEGENSLIDEFLKANLEESTGKKLKEVVSTTIKENLEIDQAIELISKDKKLYNLLAEAIQWNINIM